VSVTRKRKVLSREARTLLEVLEIIDREGHFDTNVPWEWIEWEEVEFEDDSDYANFIHEEVPEEIERVAREIGARAYVYHLGYGVPGADYVVLIDRRGKEYTLYASYDYEEPTFTLYIMEGKRGWHEPSSTYYHPV
jgi:hypothetical protein